MRIGELPARARAGLRTVDGRTRGQVEVDARRITERATGLEGAELVVAGDEPATERIVRHLDAMVERRRRGEPLQYVVGSWGFRTLDLLVDPRVLIPRPETEGLVGLALAELAGPAAARPRRPGEATCRAVDLGTGSGAVALALVVEQPAVEVWAVDRSADALAVARANTAGVGRPGARVRLAEGSWFDPLPEAWRATVDLVVANPPYVAEGDELPPEVSDWEPTAALVSGPTGLEAVEDVVGGAPAWLRSGGTLLVEIGETQGPTAAELAGAAGLVDVEVLPDLAGRDRYLRARR